ncbi:MAG TPA: hypothetical protein VFW95_06110 [Candidatus Limnocylindria bacterium]|nr:hypothetical protein [Candidatus Limnocylindria bacterium]
MAEAPTDLDLLRRHEPIVRYTLGETFFPMDVTTYMAAATLWERLPDGIVRALAAPGELDAISLSEKLTGVTGFTYLNVATEVPPTEVARSFLAGERLQAVGFHRGPGRLARVGYLSRLVDALFALSLILRGRVPGGIAHQSAAWYRHLESPPHRYYGRVVREGGWTVLQYWFFYAYNDWRSGFNGANDHEADWEQIMVYLSPDTDGGLAPRWVAYAQHDYHGEALRRRWDDATQLEVVDGHPVVFAGAGSHASYFIGGEYLAEQELRLPRPIQAVVQAVGSFFGAARGSGRLLPIAFVDYARGDGVAIGPGQDRDWDPVLLDAGQTWAFDFRGLWGVSVQDPFEGEEAPAGPVYNRDASIRGSWADPLGFAGLDGVPPPDREAEVLAGRRSTLLARRAELGAEIEAAGRELAASGAELQAVRSSSPLEERSDEAGLAVLALRDRHRELRREDASLDDRIRAIELRLERIAEGDTDPTSGRPVRIAAPMPTSTLAYGRVLELWAAISIGLLLILVVAALAIAPRLGLLAAIVLIGTFIFIESLLRGTVVPLVRVTSVLLASIAALILIVTFWLPIVVAMAIAAGAFVIWQNLRELVRA